MSETKDQSDEDWKFLAELRNEFVAELPERIDVISQHIKNLENHRNTEAEYAALFRQVHSLKGTAGTFGLGIITTIAHAMESEMESARKHSALGLVAGAGLFYKHVDLIQECLNLVRDGKDDMSGIQAGLEEIGRSSPFVNQSRLLALETNRIVIRYIKESVKALPVEIRFISNGFQALESLYHHPPRFFVTSMEGSELNGRALVAAIKLTPHLARTTRCIVVSSGANHSFPDGLKPDVLLPKNASLGKKLGSYLESELAGKV